MFVPLFAADAGLDVPWWVTEILLPLGIGAIGGVTSIIVVSLTISRTEWYRRLARWEPYGEKLWTVQIDLYAAVCHAATEAMREAYEYVYNVRHGEPEHNKPFLELAIVQERRTAKSS